MPTVLPMISINPLLTWYASVSVYGPSDGWFGRLYELVQRLEDMPKRHPVDRVYSEMAGAPTRKMNLGKYLVFYQVDDDRCRVDVVAFTHGAARREV